MTTMNTISIEQSLQIKPWPLEKPGDEMFFGYVVAMGLFPLDWMDENGKIPYVDFAYNDSYERYQLPPDKNLTKQLRQWLADNMRDITHSGCIYGKAWIKKTKTGYDVFLP